MCEQVENYTGEKTAQFFYKDGLKVINRGDLGHLWGDMLLVSPSQEELTAMALACSLARDWWRSSGPRIESSIDQDIPEYLTMKRVKPTRNAIRSLHQNSYEIALATQTWSKQLGRAWQQANKKLLDRIIIIFAALDAKKMAFVFLKTAYIEVCEKLHLFLGREKRKIEAVCT